MEINSVYTVEDLRGNTDEVVEYVDGIVGQKAIRGLRNKYRELYKLPKFVLRGYEINGQFYALRFDR